MKVLYFSEIPAPYRVDLFNEMGKTIQLTVVFLAEYAKERNKAWQSSTAENFQAVFPNHGGIRLKRFDLSMVKYLRQHAAEYDLIVLQGYSFLASVLAVAWLRQKNIPYGLEADGAILPVKESLLKSSVKRFCIKNAHYWLSSGKATDDFFVHYGASRERCLRYPFTSLFRADVDNAKRLCAEEKRELRNGLAISEEKVILSVGRFSYRSGYGKGYDLLMKVAEKLADRDIGFYFVGDRPTREFVEWKARKGLDHVHFIDFVNKSKLSEYYACADLFVLLTRGDVWGLAVNEAMAFALPVVTTTACLAGLELVWDNENGFLVDVNDLPGIFRSIGLLIGDEDKLKSFGRKSAEIIADYTLEESAAAHIRALSEVLEGESLS